LITEAGGAFDAVAASAAFVADCELISGVGEG
jgi:hypothetical protein